MPFLSRDHGAEILSLVNDADASTDIALRDSLSFASDSLLCEWAYVIDLDKNTLEVFKGFNKAKLEPSERFFGIEREEDSDMGYEPIKHVITFDLDALPRTVPEFIALAEPPEKDEEAEEMQP